MDATVIALLNEATARIPVRRILDRQIGRDSMTIVGHVVDVIKIPFGERLTGIETEQAIVTNCREPRKSLACSIETTTARSLGMNSAATVRRREPSGATRDDRKKRKRDAREARKRRGSEERRTGRLSIDRTISVRTEVRSCSSILA